MRKSFLEKFWYKYEYLGAVEKDGQVYKKYKKIRRFHPPSDFMNSALAIIFVVAGVIAISIFTGLLVVNRR